MLVNGFFRRQNNPGHKLWIRCLFVCARVSCVYKYGRKQVCSFVHCVHKLSKFEPARLLRTRPLTPNRKTHKTNWIVNVEKTIENRVQIRVKTFLLRTHNSIIKNDYPIKYLYRYLFCICVCVYVSLCQLCKSRSTFQVYRNGWFASSSMLNVPNQTNQQQQKGHTTVENRLLFPFFLS